MSENCLTCDIAGHTESPECLKHGSDSGTAPCSVNAWTTFGERLPQIGMAIDVMAEDVPHPRKTLIPRATMQPCITLGNHLVQRKYDGEFSTIQIAGATILCEFMRKKISGHFYTSNDLEMFRQWPGGWYAALTVADIDGENVLAESTLYRWGYLNAQSKLFPANVILAETVTDVDQCFAAGAEGICAHDWCAPWASYTGGATMFVVKRTEIHLCRVTGRCGGSQSVFIADAMTGQPRGKVTLRGGKCDQVRIGSIIRVECMGITQNGLLRQTQPCREWLYQP